MPRQGWTEPVACPFWNEESKLQASFKKIEISEDQLLEIFN